jgi:thiopurine S-methyltransferase
MEEEYWLNKWQQQDIKWHKQNITQELIDHFDKLALQPGDAILLPLCGKTKDMLWLAEQGLTVIGVELSPIACEDFFREIKITPQITQEGDFVKYHFEQIEIYCGDIFNLTASMLPDIKAIFDCRALVALPITMRLPYTKHLMMCSKFKAQILLITMESSHEVAGPPFSIEGKEVNALYGEHYTIELLAHHQHTYIFEHLVEKGYRDLSEKTYLLKPISK